jgi:MFS superfamily sulfate permease-like transporter
MALPQAVWKGIFPVDGSSHHQAAAIGLVTIGIIVGWKALVPKKLQMLPGTLLGVVIATVATVALGLSIKQVDVPANITSAISLPTGEAFAKLASVPILVAAAGLAFVASAETLLSTAAVDKMHNGPRAQYDRELAVQGVGNMICGVVGGLPMTGVIVRSSANVEAGARTRASAIMHGAWLLLSVAALPWLLKMIPTASLAALLVFTGYKLVNIKVLKDLRQYGKGEVFIYLATLVCIVVFDLLTGVVVGVVLSALKLLYRFSHLDIELKEQPDRARTVLYLRGAATFIRLPKLAATLDGIPASTELHVHFEDLDYIDHACLDLLINWEKQHSAAGGRLVIDWDQLTACFQSPATPAREELATAA